MAEHRAFSIDDRDLQSLLSIGEDAQAVIDAAARALATATHAKIVEEAHLQLHSRLPAYLDALELTADEDAYLIVLGKEADWIESGMSAHSMLESLLASPKAKVSKEGNKYLVVPFEHARTGSNPRAMPSAASSLGEAIRKELRAAKISATKIERHDDGTPKFGVLHRMNIQSGPKARDRSGLGQGRPLLQGLTISQTAAPTKAGAVRSLMTFRVASSKQEGKWQHPGIEAANIFETASAWADDQWSRVIFPELVEKLTGIRTM